MIDNTTKNFFYKNGYCVLKNILTNDEVENLKHGLEEGLKKKNNIQKYDYFNEDEKFWPYISNKKILNSLNSLLNDEVFFMDGGFTNYKKISKDIDEYKISWHRDTDTAPKIKGVVPYCKENNFYKVFTVMTYLNKDMDNTISLIPKSHRVEYKTTLNNILRILHWKTRSKKNVLFIRKIIENIISKKMIIQTGDCLVFFVGLFHKVVAPKNSGYRKALITRYAPRSINSENYINYILKNSSRIHYSEKRFLNFNQSQSFINYLKNKNIFYQ